ncbi:MAG: hypothetical protein ACE5EX_11480, partial [Phycisphaerae bacterium]
MIADATGVVVMKTCPRTTSDNTPGGSPASTPARQSGRSVLILLVGAAALVMGAGTLGGSFVGGDDHRLLLNHVLVNHPSPAHAIKLFTIWHRDL